MFVRRVRGLQTSSCHMAMKMWFVVLTNPTNTSHLSSQPIIPCMVKTTCLNPSTWKLLKPLTKKKHGIRTDINNTEVGN